MHDKRRFTRIISSLDVDLHLADGTVVVSCLRNLSMRGVYVETGKEVEVGQACTITLFPAGRDHEQVMKVEGTIARATEGGVGIRFDDISAEDLDRLRGIVVSASKDAARIDGEIEEHLQSKPGE